MPDFIYLLENRLSADQRDAVRLLRTAAQEAGMILFLTGDAVRDLTSGHAVHELNVTVHGNALKLKKPIEKAGAKVWGEDPDSRTLYLCFPGTVRVDVISAHSAEYPKPGKPVYHWATIQEDLRRRDFTVNAMAISLNEGSFGLLMDPLNGAADIEARALRLVSNYGFLEDPALLIRAARYRVRLGWELDPRTQTRYENAKAEGVIEHLSAQARSEELEQIGHEEDGLKVLEALEAEGWMKVLFPAWTPAKADAEGLKTLHDQAVELQVQGIHPDMSAAQMQLLTAKLGSKDVAALKKHLLRPGFVEEWNSLDSIAAGFAKALLAKDRQTPSSIFKLFKSYDPEAILWLGFTTKDQNVKDRYNQFLKVWPEARQRTPHLLMQEMRITPELATYQQIVDAIFLELIDGKLTTPEEMRAFLEPHSPPAPPPQITIKRTRAKRGMEPKIKEPAFDDEDAEEGVEDEDLDEIGGDDEEIDLGIPIPKGDLDADLDEGEAEADEDDEEDADEAPVRSAGKKGAKSSANAEKPAPAGTGKKPAASPPAPASSKQGKVPAPAPAAKPQPEAAKKPVPPAESKEKPAPAPPAKAGAAQVKPLKAPAQKPAPKPAPAKSASKPTSKPAPKTAPKPAPAKAKPAAKKPVLNPAAKRPASKPVKPAAKKPAPAPKKKH